MAELLTATQITPAMRDNATRWYTLTRIFPELTILQTRQQWDLWQKNHIAVETNMWRFKEIYDMWYLTSHHISAEQKPAHLPIVDPRINTGTGTLATLAVGLGGGLAGQGIYRHVVNKKLPPPPDLTDYTLHSAKRAVAQSWIDGKVRFGEHDVLMSEKEVFEKWLKDNKEKNANSKRAQAYKDSEQFKEDRITRLIVRRDSQITDLANQEKGKVYSNPQQDPIYLQLNRDALVYAQKIIDEAKQYPRMYKQMGITAKDQKIRNQQILQYSRGIFLAQFARDCPVKAAAYAPLDENLAVQRKILRKEIKPEDAQKATITAKLEFPPVEKPAVETAAHVAAAAQQKTLQTPLSTPPGPATATPPTQPPQPISAPAPTPARPPSQTPSASTRTTPAPSYIPKITTRSFSSFFYRPPAPQSATAAQAATVRVSQSPSVSHTIPNPRSKSANAAAPVNKAISQALGMLETALGPQFKIFLLIVVGILIVLILIAIWLTGGFGLPPTTGHPAANLPIPGLETITKSGPDHVENGENITYKINFSYTGSLDVLVSDPIPDNTEFVSADPDCGDNCKPGTHAVSWRLNDLKSKVPNGQYNFTLVVHPTKDDIIVTNKVIATAASSGFFTGGNGCPTQEQLSANAASPQTCQYLNPNIDIHDTSFSDTQAQQYISLYQSQSGLSPSEFQSRVQTIIATAKEVGINPVIPLGYWRTESRFQNGFGCPTVPGDFQSQLNCILGGPASAQFSDKTGAVGTRCARDGAGSAACQEEQGIRSGNAEIYSSIPIGIPIQKFDDLAETIGSRAPNLSEYNCKKYGTDCSVGPNQNCTHTYNQLVETAEAVGACKATASPVNAGGLAACTFSRGGASAPYQSPKLLGYFQEVSQKTGFPAALLAALVKIESTTGTYSISTYTDDDITKMEQAAASSTLIDNIDATIDGTKALCPTSVSGALGLSQIEPPNNFISANEKSPNRTFDLRGAYDGVAVQNGANLIGKNADQLSIQDYCTPKTNLMLAVGFILGKLHETGLGDGKSYGDGKTWDPNWNTNKSIIDQVATRFYGGLTYNLGGGTYSYGDDLYNGLNNCPVK
ncbi:MAG TPA: hypothetical protein VLF68_01050 [Candidatus Saccharimonadales bacterium]|nr:hypothetical protein [Candidatus Saccharimonadales bacterium]